MVELLSMFTLEQIFIVMIVAIGFMFGIWKGFTAIWDRWKAYKTQLSGELTEQQRVEEIRNNILSEMAKLSKAVDLLINSDRTRIKGQFLYSHKMLKKQGWVDPNTL